MKKRLGNLKFLFVDINVLSLFPLLTLTTIHYDQRMNMLPSWHQPARTAIKAEVLLRRSFFSGALRLWNMLPNNVKTSPVMGEIKKMFSFKLLLVEIDFLRRISYTLILAIFGYF